MFKVRHEILYTQLKKTSRRRGHRPSTFNLMDRSLERFLTIIVMPSKVHVTCDMSLYFDLGPSKSSRSLSSTIVFDRPFWIKRQSYLVKHRPFSRDRPFLTWLFRISQWVSFLTKRPSISIIRHSNVISLSTRSLKKTSWIKRHRSDWILAFRVFF